MALKKLLSEHFPDLKWMPRLTPLFNAMVDEITRLTTKGIQVGANMDAELREVLVDGTYPLKLSWTRTNQPTHITIGRIRKASGETLNLASAVSLDWNYNNAGEIQINSVVGLSPSPSSKYYINLLILTK